MIAELLSKRYSVRDFQNRRIPDTIVREILQAGRLSPSGGNEQPWLFTVVSSGPLIQQISTAAYGQDWIAKAPLVIVLCARIVEDARGARDIQKQRFPEHSDAIDAMDKELYASLNLEEHQTKIAGTHMAMAALEHGIGSTWVSRFEVRRVASLLNLAQGILPSEMLVLGYPASQGSLAPKKSLKELTCFHTD